MLRLSSGLARRIANQSRTAFAYAASDVFDWTIFRKLKVKEFQSESAEIDPETKTRLLPKITV
jgi:hypothetical protein